MVLLPLVSEHRAATRHHSYVPLRRRVKGRVPPVCTAIRTTTPKRLCCQIIGRPFGKPSCAAAGRSTLPCIPTQRIGCIVAAFRDQSSTLASAQQQHFWLCRSCQPQKFLPCSAVAVSPSLPPARLLRLHRRRQDALQHSTEVALAAVAWHTPAWNTAIRALTAFDKRQPATHQEAEAHTLQLDRNTPTTLDIALR